MFILSNSENNLKLKNKKTIKSYLMLFSCNLYSLKIQNFIIKQDEKKAFFYEEK
jgi:hypothetical protein